ncbi:hypothetical protein [Pseudoflavitalea rhizosphaerae]|uniref:hypothetical protein n=1 Tax=Pseudoflavitalea rhizosphaerae TaxID=1884793 RepID=UPI0013DE9ADD|nr:hypothetical protein [Pseudoflavitalea rhizosphaerae]
MQGRNAKLVLTKYAASTDQLNALYKAGYDLRGTPVSGYTPARFGFEVTGNVSVAPIARYAANLPHNQARSKCKLHLNNSSNDYCTPEFNEVMKEAMQKKKQASNGKSHWEETGYYYNITVTGLYITDFINEIEKILGKHKKETAAASVDKAVAEAEKAMMTGNLSYAETMLNKAYQLDPRHAGMVAASRKFAQLKKEKEDREDKNRIIEAEIQARQREKDIAQNEAAELQTLRGWDAASPNNLSPQSRNRLRELEKRNTERQLAKIDDTFESIRDASRKRHEQRRLRHDQGNE